MNDIDRYLDQACRSVSGPVTLRRHLRNELKEHLEEAIRDLVASGISPDEATRNAIEGFGEPEMIREGLQSVYGQSVTSLFVDKAMEWKERTMKSDWKWSFAAQTGLVLIIALAAIGIALMMLWIVPVVVEVHSERGTEISDHLQAAIGVAAHISRYWYLWAIALAGGLGLFEWKCKSENKALIRIVIGVAASLVSIVLAFWTAGATMVSLVFSLK